MTLYLEVLAAALTLWGLLLAIIPELFVARKGRSTLRPKGFVRIVGGFMAFAGACFFFLELLYRR